VPLARGAAQLVFIDTRILRFVRLDRPVLMPGRALTRYRRFRLIDAGIDGKRSVFSSGWSVVAKSQTADPQG
jgi:hypothetical protein